MIKPLFNKSNYKKLQSNKVEINKCEIEINNNKIPLFSYTHEFNKEGTYTIKYSFKNALKNISYIFYNCSFSTLLFNLNTKNINYVKYMFNQCCLLNLDLSNFDSEGLTDMSYMFCGIKSLKKLKLSNFNTKKITDMSFMFKGCSSLLSLDLSSFNTENGQYVRKLYFFKRIKFI